MSGSPNRSWPQVPARRLFSVIEDRGLLDLPLLSSSSLHGVVPREQLESRVAMPQGDTAQYKRALPGDFVISMGSFDTGIEYSAFEGLVSPAYTVLRPCPGLVHGYYRHLLKSGLVLAELSVLARGIRQGKTITWDDFATLRLPLPPEATQLAIAAHLDSETARIDALISKKKRLIALIDERRSELRREAVESLVDLGVPLSQFRRMVRATHAGEVIDQSWWGDGEETLFTCARDPVRSNFEHFPSDRRTTGDEILLTRNGTPYVHLPPVGAIYTNVVQRVVLDHRIDRGYASLALDVASQQMHRQGVSIDSLNFTMWKELRIPVPSLETQRLLMSRLGESDSFHKRNVDLLKRQIDLLREHRQALITAAVTGEIEVPGIAA